MNNHYSTSKKNGSKAIPLHFLLAAGEYPLFLIE